ncbi:MAG: calcium-binding protein, partial [Selenomonadaceae bacterium]|nr:calcium-binding protein [Selenomonadaceae bacterium]
VTIDGGEGNDTIQSYDPRVSLSGGAGADVISLQPSGFTNVTINAGTGNDTVYGDSLGGGVLYQYKKGDGNDLIYNYSATDSITITGGGSWSTTTSGNNVIVNVAGSGNMTLVGAKGKTLNIYPKSTPPDPTPPTTLSSGVTAQDVIKKFMKSLDTTSNVGIAALNEAVSVASGGYFSNINAAINQMVADCNTTKNATKFLSEYCDIDLTNVDTGAITGYDAGGSTTQKSSSNIVPETGSLDSSFTGSSFTTNGLNVVLSNFDGNMNPYEISYSNLSNSAQKYIWQALETWWAKNSLDLIAQSYGNNYGFTSASTATVKKLYFGFVNDDNNTLATTWTWGYRSNASQLAMTVNMKYYNGIEIDNVDGQTSSTTACLDRTLAHEMTHAVMSANIYSVGSLPQFIKEGMSELTHGIDDHRPGVIRSLAGNADSLASSLSLFDTGTGVNMAYAGGYMFLRYLAKQGSLHYPSSLSGSAAAAQSKSSAVASSGSSSGVSVKNSVLTLAKDFSDSMLDLTNYSSVKTVNATAMGTGIMMVGNKNPLSISAGTGADSIFANVGNDTINGGAGKDILYGEAGNDVIKGDDGDDSLNGGDGNDTLTGGDGKDVFIFGTNSGNDVITDYTAGQDKIKLLDGSVTSASVSGSDVVLQLGASDTITIKGGKGQKITVIDGDGKETTKTYGGGGGDTIDSDKTLKVTKTSVTLDSAYANADASSMKKAVKITGNDAANSIVGGSKADSLYGGKGADTLQGKGGNDKLFGDGGNDFLWGESGNDTLTGGDGNDVFIYSAGKDVIADYATGDKISLGAAISKSSVKGSDVIFTIGSGSLTVKNGKGKSLSMIDSTGKEFTYGEDPDVVRTLKVTKTAVTLDSAYANANASAMTKAVKITGNDAANSIVGGSKNDSLYGGTGNDTLLGKAGNDKIYGQAGDDVLYGGAGNDSLWGGDGNDTLWGEAGNDTLFGGDGNDVFIYGAGKDVISGFDTGDMLQITEAFTGTYNKSSKTISIKVGSTASAITIKDFTATTFNINGDSYGISGTKLVKK